MGMQDFGNPAGRNKMRAAGGGSVIPGEVKIPSGGAAMGRVKSAPVGSPAGSSVTGFGGSKGGTAASGGSTIGGAGKAAAVKGFSSGSIIAGKIK